MIYAVIMILLHHVMLINFLRSWMIFLVVFEFIYLLCSKAEVHSDFRSLFAMISRQFGCDVKTGRSDNGTKFFCMQENFNKMGG